MAFGGGESCSPSAGEAAAVGEWTPGKLELLRRVSNDVSEASDPECRVSHGGQFAGGPYTVLGRVRCPNVPNSLSWDRLLRVSWWFWCFTLRDSYSVPVWLLNVLDAAINRAATAQRLFPVSPLLTSSPTISTPSALTIRQRFPPGLPGCYTRTCTLVLAHQQDLESSTLPPECPHSHRPEVRPRYSMDLYPSSWGLPSDPRGTARAAAATDCFGITTAS
ncbi:hypothetical protein BV898_19697 [Hypsibius exemplaris]|uniref:Uncharacterized protein n=1 Tax=Hypsibius exemplaris TaxID=2072580 RepID=A0A9X6NSM7_HYPEX|nr:hypothetical protein BV898_19697 [Hypsibius exemplaris]